MKLSTCATLLFLVTSMFASKANSQNVKVDISGGRITIENLMEQIESQTDFLFVYSKNEVNTNQTTTVSEGEQTVENCLSEALSEVNMSYDFKDDYIVLKEATRLQQENKITITGTVTDSGGETLPGAVIIAKNESNNVTTADIDGKYAITINEGTELEFSYIGYNTQVVNPNGRAVLNVILSLDTDLLDEVVIVGYGTQKKSNLSGALGVASGDVLENRPVANIGQALQGAIGNLNITNNSGQANSVPKFNIRGTTSITGGEPLILVDNIPITADEFSRINSQDIENVTVLKDASSAAIYGARASFGVILITTKKGRGEKIQISYSGNVSMNNMTNFPDFVMDPYTVANWKNIAGEGYYNFFDAESLAYAKRRSEDPSLPVAFLSAAKPEIWQYFGSTNWFEEVYKPTSLTHSHNVSISGATDKVGYYFSADLYDSNGVLKVGSDEYDRYNFRSRLDYKATDWLEIGTNIAYTYYTNDQPYNFYDDGDDDPTMFFHNINRISTLEVSKNQDGTWTDRGAGIMGRLTEGGRNVAKSGNLQATLSVGLNLIKDVLTIKANATFKKKNVSNHNWDVPIPAKKGPNKEPSLTSHDPFTTNPFSNRYSIEEDYAVFDVFANFQKTIGEFHDISAIVGFNQEEFRFARFGAGRDMLISGSLPSHQLATGTMSMNEKIESWALRGAFYRLNYAYKNKYIIETNGRYDGSSRFPKNDRFGFFPSVSGAWVLSEEAFFKPLSSVVDFLKIRGSYGVLGNQNVDVYEYMSNMTAETLDGVLLDGEIPIGVNPSRLVSPSLTWEEVETINIGLDLRMFSDRLTIGADVYQRNTKGMLSKGQALPNVLGTDVPKENAADLRVDGWEVAVNWRDAFQVGNKPFNYSATFILSDNHATITKFTNPTNSLSDDQYYAGQKLGEIWGLNTLGYFQSLEEIENSPDHNKIMAYPNAVAIAPGDLKFEDTNDDGEISNGKWTLDDPGDYSIIGNSTPRYNFSLDLSVEWNNFDLRLFFQGVGKRDWYPNAGNHYYWGMYAQPWTNVLESNMDHWTPETPNATYPRPKSYIAEMEKELGAPQTKYMQSAAYCRLKNLTFGYTIPQSITSRINVKNIRVYFSGENLFTIKSLPKQIDPEGLRGYIYPYFRTFSFGLNITL